MKANVNVKLVIGPAGTGKTHTCVTEVCRALRSSVTGPPLVFIVPKQATFQIEKQVLASEGVPGYTRLHILSFERLAEKVLSALAQPLRRVLTEEGKIVVLRAIVHQEADHLHVFRSAARLPGFAAELATILTELQQHGVSANRLRTLAGGLIQQSNLQAKLMDLALIMDSYTKWLEAHYLHDAGALLELAAEALNNTAKSSQWSNVMHPRWGGLWLDGFAELTPRELDLLIAMLPFCNQATLAFCADPSALQPRTWNSIWTVVARTLQPLIARLEALPWVTLEYKYLDRQNKHGRFAGSPALASIESQWEITDLPQQHQTRTSDPTCRLTSAILGGKNGGSPATPPDASRAIRIVCCPTQQLEVVVAAREILDHVHKGGRFRDTAVLLRSLATHADIIRRVFKQYEIPFFLDRRESVAHHPLVELTRTALRTVAFDWQHEDWITALKTGLMPVNDDFLDRLENEALARGWDKNHWLEFIHDPQHAQNTDLAGLARNVIGPFYRFANKLSAHGNKPTGQVLVDAVRSLWADLRIPDRLTEWSNEPPVDMPGTVPPVQLHYTVWEQLNELLDNILLAFGDTTLHVREWTPVLEAGFSSLTVGLIPPALDQVLVGAIDRSRNPNLALAVILGMNASLFPTPPPKPCILSESDRLALANQGFDLATNDRMHMAREKFFAYIACTRSSQRLVITYAERDANDRPLNPSQFISPLRRIFPNLQIEQLVLGQNKCDYTHHHELIRPMISILSKLPSYDTSLPVLEKYALSSIAKAIAGIRSSMSATISGDVAELLYGPQVFRCSVSQLEQFAQCPFKFFVNTGLGAKEREVFELDARNIGSFLHEALAEFHCRLSAQGLRWRDLTPQQAKTLAFEIASEMVQSYGHGVFKSAHDRRVTAPVLINLLEGFVEQCVLWMQTGYSFDPVAVEVAFGMPEASLPEWVIPVDTKHSIALRGKVDRVDVHTNTSTGEQWCVVIDYKLSQTKFDETQFVGGLQLQLPSYLAAITNLAQGRITEKPTKWVPAGMFYVPLRPSDSSAATRNEATADPNIKRLDSHVHRGRFRADALPQLDRLHDQATCSGQFSAARRGNSPRKYSDAITPEEFNDLLRQTQELIVSFGRQIFEGNVSVDPCAINSSNVACDRCQYSSICRINRSRHSYRLPSCPRIRASKQAQTDHRLNTAD